MAIQPVFRLDVLFQFALWIRASHPVRVGDRGVVSSRITYKLGKSFLRSGSGAMPPSKYVKTA